jgi:peptidoglycan/LPS O-acetylase OafA/YrhL
MQTINGFLSNLNSHPLVTTLKWPFVAAGYLVAAVVALTLIAAAVVVEVVENITRAARGGPKEYKCPAYDAERKRLKRDG